MAKTKGGKKMAKKTKDITAIVSIVAGIIIVAIPQILAWVIGLFLVISGVLNLIDRKEKI